MKTDTEFTCWRWTAPKDVLRGFFSYNEYPPPKSARLPKAGDVVEFVVVEIGELNAPEYLSAMTDPWTMKLSMRTRLSLFERLRRFLFD